MGHWNLQAIDGKLVAERLEVRMFQSRNTTNEAIVSLTPIY
jgi:hypothetical protein